MDQIEMLWIMIESDFCHSHKKSPPEKEGLIFLSGSSPGFQLLFVLFQLSFNFFDSLIGRMFKGVALDLGD